MKKIAMLILSFLATSTSGFAENLTLENRTAHPMKDPKSKMAIQWASSAGEVEEANQAVTNGRPLNKSSLDVVSQSGKVQVSIPKKAEYFRVIVWSHGGKEPDLLTNWVEITPNKTYRLEGDHLVPAVLMAGTGC